MDGFTPLTIAFGDGAAAEYADRDVKRGEIAKVIGLDVGTTKGKPTIAFVVEIEDGTTAICETTWALAHAALTALYARFGSPL